MGETAGNMLEKPLFDGADSAKQLLCEKLKENDKTLVDSIKSLAVVCGKAVETGGLKILKESALLYIIFFIKFY